MRVLLSPVPKGTSQYVAGTLAEGVRARRPSEALSSVGRPGHETCAVCSIIRTGVFSLDRLITHQ